MRRWTIRVAAFDVVLLIALLILCDRLLWRSDWSQFLPDVLTAVATGLGIGIVLWRLEAWSRLEGLKREARRDWEALRRRVRVHSSEGYTYTLQSLRVTSFGVEGIRALVAGQQIHAWSEVLRLSEIQVLIDYLAAADELDLAADALSTHIASASLEFEPSRDGINAQAVFVVMSWVDPYRREREPTEPDAAEVGYILATKSVVEATAEFRSKIFHLESLWADLGESLSGASWRAR